MRLLMLPRYDVIGASSRLRTFQYIPALVAAGIEIRVAPLLGDGYVTDLYAGKISVLKVASAYFRRLLLLRSANSYDVVWLEKELFPWLPAWVESRLLPSEVAVVADYDDAMFHRYDQHRSRSVRWLLGQKIDQVMGGADLVTAGNGYLAERARAAGAPHVEWLPTVVDLDRYPAPVRKTNEDEIVIGWIGSPATAHYLQEVNAVLADIASRYAIRCVAIGARADQIRDTPFEAWHWSEAGEVAMLHQFDIGIMPLLDAPWERGKCGYKLIQYMACGLPVVASPVGVNEEIVRQGENGHLARTVDEWRLALERLITDTNLRHRMGAKGRRLVEETYSMQAQAGRLAELLLSAISRKLR